MKEKNHKYIFFLTLLFVLIGILLRFYQLNFENYWWDEMLGFWVTDPNISLDQTFYRREITDQTSILFHILLKNYYKFFGYNSEIGRYIPFIFGSVSIPLLGILSYQIKKNNSYLLTILLASINIYLIQYSQETRYYSLVFLLSIINLIFYYKILLLNLEGFNRTFVFISFILISVLSFSLNPFILIIFFSQIIYCLYLFYFHKIKNYLFFLSIPIILISYVILNYDYLFLELVSKKNHFVPDLDWRFIYNFFFPRFFGSAIMGFLYLFFLFFLLINFRKKIFNISNNFLPLIFILFFSYLIPFLYGLFSTPILFDRYIIFVLIPIIILISTLIFEIKKKNTQNFLILLILLPTFINHFLEVKYKENTKPEFNILVNYLNESDTKNYTFFVDNKVDVITLEIVENYVKSLKLIKKNNYKLFSINNLPNELDSIWVICYEPFTGLDCEPLSNESNNWTLVNNKKFHLLNAKLFKIKN